MNRLLVLTALLACVGLHDGPSAEAVADSTAAKSIFVGWVDISLEDWTILGYADKQSWSEVIDRNNQVFQRVCQTKLPGLQVKGAKNRSDEEASSHDIHVKFSDVKFDVDSYALRASVHFLDTESGSELASLPLQSYRGGHFSVDNCMRGALEKLGEKLTKEIVRLQKK